MKRLSMACICIVFIISMAGCSREPQKTEAPTKPAVTQEEPKREALPSTAGNEVLATTTLLATISDKESPAKLNAPSGHGPAPAQNPDFEITFNERGTGVAYVAESMGKSYVVHNGRPGKTYKSIGAIALSPDGHRVAYSALNDDDSWRVVTDMREDKIFYHLGEPVFSPDGNHIAYTANINNRWHIIVDNNMNAGSDAGYDKPVFSADSSKIAYTEIIGDNRKRLFVSDLRFTKQRIIENVASPININSQKTKIAVVVAKGISSRVVSLSFDKPDAVTESIQYDDIDMPVFGNDGIGLAFITGKAQGGLFLVLNGTEDRLPPGSPAGVPVISPDGKAVGIILTYDEGFFFHQAFHGSESAEKKYEEAAYLVYSGDGRKHAYAARRDQNWFVVVNGKEGPAFDRVVMPVFSPDGSKLIYRVRKDGKRFVVVADSSGKIIRKHPSYEQVFQPVFTSDGKSVAYGVKDGRKLIWKVEKLEK